MKNGRLTSKSYHINGFDPVNLYAPVVKHEGIQMFMAKSAGKSLIVAVADISNAYFYGHIDRDIYMA